MHIFWVTNWSGTSLSLQGSLCTALFHISCVMSTLSKNLNPQLASIMDGSAFRSTAARPWATGDRRVCWTRVYCLDYQSQQWPRDLENVVPTIVAWRTACAFGSLRCSTENCGTCHSLVWYAFWRWSLCCLCWDFYSDPHTFPLALQFCTVCWDGSAFRSTAARRCFDLLVVVLGKQ